MKKYIILLLILLAGYLTAKYISTARIPHAAYPNSGLEVEDGSTPDTSEIQAWIYPGEPTCDVSSFIKRQKIHTLKPEFFTISEQGKITLLDEASHGCNAFSSDFVSLLKSASSQQLVTVSGHAIEMRKLFSTTSGIDAAVATLVEFVVKHDLTGIEIDFEDFSAWSESDYQKYLKFIGQLGKSLQEKGKKLAVDGPPISNAEEQSYYRWKYSDFESLPVDYLVVMAYDYQNDFGAPNPISPNVWLAGIIGRIKQEISNPRRIVIGLPAYGYEAQNGSTVVQIRTYSELSRLNGFETAVRNPNSYELQWSSGNRAYNVVDSEGLNLKRDLVSSLGIDTVSIWHLGGNPWFK